jgi:hypothetical protein
MAKVFCGETLFNAVFRTMQAMGVNALDRTHPLEKFLREAAVFPLYDAGNIGMRMRKIWGVMLDEDFDPRAIADSRPMKFKKSMEGVGTSVAVGSATPARAAGGARTKKDATPKKPWASRPRSSGSCGGVGDCSHRGDIPVTSVRNFAQAS